MAGSVGATGVASAIGIAVTNCGGGQAIGLGWGRVASFACASGSAAVSAAATGGAMPTAGAGDGGGTAPSALA